MTSIQRGPVFISQPHFYETLDLNDSCIFIDEKGNKVEANLYDNSFEKIEPTTGTAIKA